MTDFFKSTACQFGDWLVPLVVQDETLGRIMLEHADFDEKARLAFQEWSQKVRENHAQIEYQLLTGYDLPELEMLRIEACFCIIQGHWQGAVCLTNILLEAFLKLSPVYYSAKEPEEHAQPLSRLMNSLSAPVNKYMRMKLNDTINAACKVGLISEEAKNVLHEYRERFRNAFFHADMQAMFGDQTTLVTAANFDCFKTEGPIELPIHSVPFMLGEAMWQNAHSNAIPYFKEVDALIRKTLPKVFPNLHQEQTESTNGDAR